MKQLPILSHLVVAALLAGCAAGPSITDRYAVNTPVFADNRVFHLGMPVADGSQKPKQPLVSLGATIAPDDKEVVKANEPLSIVVRSIELPGVVEGGPISGPADYAVILDVGTAADGSSQSLVVWYQRGVQPNQSLNFSNLLVYFEPRWDERVAPFFRIRLMEVTTERNEQTRQALERAQKVANVIGTFAATPLASPLISVAFSAADMVLANRQNRMILDYSVQLYSSSAQARAGSGRLGALKTGSYIVVGKPNTEPRTFWQQSFGFEPEGRTLEASGKLLNVPTALITVGTFESIVPKLVIERSAALTTLLASGPSKSSIEQVDESVNRLQASVKAYVYGEKLKRYKNATTITDFISWLDMEGTDALVGAEDVFYLVRAANDCLKPAKPFGNLDTLKTFVEQQATLQCAGQ